MKSLLDGVSHHLYERGNDGIWDWRDPGRDLIWVNNSGLVSVTNTDYRIRDQYYALRHYSLFTDPGYQRLSVSSTDEDIRASAFIAPDESRITLVVLNTGTSDETFNVDTAEANYSQSRGYMTVYDPGNSSTWISIDGLGEDLSVTLPPRSQLTIILD